MAVEPIALASTESPGSGMLRCADTQSGYTILIGPPHADPRLWREYLAGALAVYRHYGAEEAVEYDAWLDGSTTALFCVALDSDGRVVAGVRAEGPHQHVDQVHAVRSWAGRAGDAAFRKLVADQIPDGVIESKTGWVAPDAEHRHALADWVARAIVQSTVLLGARYSTGIAPSHVIDRYRTTGMAVVWWVPSSGYPNDRYITHPVWWDMENYRERGTPEQVRRVESELAELHASGPVDWTGGERLAQA
ncbi:hypothetical protein [Nocardia tengchongensis]|uniref:hypothetical protein n=1 Tax=Nocardia tengchongensis TaxID=2055889 RepID=UPI0036AACE29